MKIYYYILRKLGDFWHWLKRKPFHIRHGFDYIDSWALYYHNAKWLLPRLKYLRDNFYGTAMNPNGKTDSNGVPEAYTEDEWREILDKIIFSFDFIINEDKYTKLCYPSDYKWGFKTDGKSYIKWNDDREPDFSILEPYEKRYNEGMELFIKFYRNLWD